MAGIMLPAACCCGLSCCPGIDLPATLSVTVSGSGTCSGCLPFTPEAISGTFELPENPLYDGCVWYLHLEGNPYRGLIVFREPPSYSAWIVRVDEDCLAGALVYYRKDDSGDSCESPIGTYTKFAGSSYVGGMSTCGANYAETATVA